VSTSFWGALAPVVTVSMGVSIGDSIGVSIGALEDAAV
jgi:hypothetical protein